VAILIDSKYNMEFTIFNKIEFISSKIRICFGLVLIAFIINMTIPQAVKAEPIFFSTSFKQEVAIASTKSLDILTVKFDEYENRINQLKNQAPIKTYEVVATAYSSDVAQTDSTPCITANGFNVCQHGEEDVIAANFLPFGAKVRFPELYGDRIFTVHDRMNQRYYYRIDFWKTSRNRAITFGKRLVKVEVVEM